MDVIPLDGCALEGSTPAAKCEIVLSALHLLVGKGAGELHKAKGIAIDKSCGLVAVTDWSGDKVNVYSYDGELLKSITGFSCPHSVIFSQNHRMIVSDSWSSQIKVYQYTIGKPSDSAAPDTHLECS